MPPLILHLDGRAIHDIASFYDEINRVFMHGEDWQLGPSLDALDDMLYGAYGVLAAHPDVALHWHAIDHSERALGIEATRAWLQAKQAAPGTFNTAAITAQLQALARGEGQPYFEIVMDIFAAHPRVVLVRA
ncbi:barstar family protein [Stenotrophomonas sp.]|uniref:barstar family protein n=1 Tax=Stenotrophomonas sp. TaxID=69392 RepID=UPI002FCC00E0